MVCLQLRKVNDLLSECGASCPRKLVARDRKGGRPAKLSPKEIKTIRALLKTADIPVAEIAARFGIARSPLSAVLKPAA